MKKIILLILALQLINNTAFPTIYITVCDGNFSQNIWIPSTPPSTLGPLDSIVINHDVCLDINYNLQDGFMIIESGARLYSNNKSLVNSGILKVYGELEVYNLSNNLLLDNYGTIKVYNNFYDNPLFNGGAANIITGNGNFLIGGYVYTNLTSVILGSVDFCKLDAGGGDPFYEHHELLGPDVTICEVPLPLTIIAFTAVAQTGSSDILITWEIEEDGPAEYILEKSNDGSVFNPVYSVNSGSTAQAGIRSYSFTDQNHTGKYYYKLRIISDGQTQSSSVIYGEPDFDGFQIYPNPLRAGEQLNIQSPDDAGFVYIFDLSGQELCSSDFNAHSCFKVPDFISANPGVYYLKIQSSEKTYYEKLVVK
jgi:hypothetical protein